MPSGCCHDNQIHKTTTEITSQKKLRSQDTISYINETKSGVKFSIVYIEKVESDHDGRYELQRHLSSKIISDLDVRILQN